MIKIPLCIDCEFFAAPRYCDNTVGMFENAYQERLFGNCGRIGHLWKERKVILYAYKYGEYIPMNEEREDEE